MFSQINHPGHTMPTNPEGGFHHPHHPDKPHNPINPGRPEKPERPEGPMTIVVNGVDRILPVGTKQLSYEDVVKLAYPNYNGDSNIIYTVVFSNGPVENKKGTLVKGDVVRVWGGMIFNVGKSNKS